MEWMNIIKTVAPTVASALGSPLAGLAISALGSMFGIEEPTQTKIKEYIEKGQLTGEQIVQLKELELRYKNEEEERGFRYAELAFKDVDSARNREVLSKDSTNKILAFLIVGSFLIIAGVVLAGYAKAETVLAGTIIGYVSAKCEQVLAYYFSSTKSSARKTELLAKSSPIQE